MAHASPKTLIVAACLAALAACQTPPASAPSTASAAPPSVKQMDIGGNTRLPYAEQGRGEPVVFVHGAVSDYRTWDRQRAALAERGWRAISYSQRYFGTDPWQQGWPAFGVQTHADDLAAFIRGLNAGPVHVVAWSYAGHITLLTALKHPQLIKSAFVFEPSVPSYVTDANDGKAIGDDAGAMFGPVAEAMKAGDNATAAKHLLDGVGERKGYFDALPADVKTVILDNARTMPLLFADKAPPISCAELAQIQPRVAIARGADVRPFFKVIADAGARCMPRAKAIRVPNQKHMWPGEDVPGFVATLDAFLRAQ